MLNKLPAWGWLHIVRRTMVSGPSGPRPSGGSMPVQYRPNEFQKFLLVWMKKYKSKADIPTFVSPELIDRCRSQARIKIANYLMVLTALASIGAIYSGKSAAKRGENLHTINQDFHRQYRESFENKEK